MKSAKTILSIIALACGVGLTGPSKTAFGQPCPLFDFSDPGPLNSHAVSDNTEQLNSDVTPQVATDGDGNWVTVWGSNVTGARGFDILFSRSTDNGTNWGARDWVNANAVSNAWDGVPRLATDGNLTWVAVWWSKDNPALPDVGSDILFSRSIDEGVSWDGDAPLNSTLASDDAIFDLDRHPHLATDGNGVWVAVWDSTNDLDGAIGLDTDILFSVSTDNGAIWSDSLEALNHFADSDNTSGWKDEDPAIASDGNVTWIAVWSSTFFPRGPSEDFEILFSVSKDKGANWGTAARVTSDDNNETDEDRHPQIATDGKETWVVVWQSGAVGDSKIKVRRTVDDGVSWEQEVLISGTSTVINQSPQIATDGQGNWFVVWESGDPLGGIGGDRDILFSRSFDDGATWTAAAALNSNAASDGLQDLDVSPHIATDGLGNWTAVWQSTNSLGGMIGGDTDVLVARLADCNQNGIPDACDLANCDDSAWCSDCNGNGILDECDILSGISDDCPSDPDKENGIPDECEVDTDGDMVPDSCDNCPNVANGNQTDTDGDTLGDACDDDDDNDCVPDDVDDEPVNPNICEDVENGIGDGCDDCSIGTDGFGPECDNTPGNDGADNDADGICDLSDNCQKAHNPGQGDTDGDTVGDACDNCPDHSNTDQRDCDGVGVGDVCAIADGLSLDCTVVGAQEGNGIPDECDLSDCDDDSPWCRDCNGNGIPDGCDIFSDPSLDCPSGTPNGIPDGCEVDCHALLGLPGSGTADSCDLTDGTSSDCQAEGQPGFGIPDECDIATGVSQDDDDNGVGNGIPDECEFGPPLAASHPHDRRKNRYISFDPNKTANDDQPVAFKVTLLTLTLGSCTGSGAPCRVDDPERDDCGICDSNGAVCIDVAIDCPLVPDQECIKNDIPCVNDADADGVKDHSAGKVWWVGPESPKKNDVHLLVSELFRKVSTDWPNPVHVGDCELVPVANYRIEAVLTSGDDRTAPGSLDVATGLLPFVSSSGWADCVGPLKSFCGGDIRTPECNSDTECAAPETCDLAWTLPDRAVNFDDVGAALALVAPGSTSVPPDVRWVDLHGNATGTPGSQDFDPPNFVLNFSDIAQIIFAFQGRPYPFNDPADCPDEPCWPGCNNGLVVDPEECDGGIGCTCCRCDPGFEKGDPLALDCVPLGACCNAGTCTEETEDSCTTGGGVYQGDGTDCTSNPCP